MKVGYVVASNEVMILRKSIGYFYREEPSDENDSGWRFLSGEETAEYMGEANNFAMYNATTIVEAAPEIAAFLDRKYPVAFEWNPASGAFVEVGSE